MEVNPKFDKLFGGSWSVEADRLYRIYPKKSIPLRGNLRSINVTAHNAGVVGSDGLTRAAAGAVLGFLVAGPVGTVLGAGVGAGRNSSKSETYSVVLSFSSGEVILGQVSPFELEAIRGHLQISETLVPQPKAAEMSTIAEKVNLPLVAPTQFFSNDSLVTRYTNELPNAETTARIVSEISLEHGISKAKVRSILIAAGVYVTQGKAKSPPGTSAAEPAIRRDVPSISFRREDGPREMRAGGGTRWQGASGKTHATRAEALADGYADFASSSQHNYPKTDKGGATGVWMVVSILLIALTGFTLFLMRDDNSPVRNVVAESESNYLSASQLDKYVEADSLKSDASADTVDDSNKRRYNALSGDAQKEVDAKIRAYDQACEISADC